jgi:4-hydroxybenzoate polyprenyltransferase
LDLRDLNRHWNTLRGGMDRLRPWFNLCRLPQSLAVAADPLAGALLVGAGLGKLPLAACLMLSASCLYAGAVALNDFHDYKSDRVENPHRPLPAGRLRRWPALGVALGLLLAGLAFSFIPGPRTGQIGLLILAVILLYEFIMKSAPAGQALPAVARALALLMGMMLVPVVDNGPGWTVGWGPRAFCMFVLGVYVVGTTIFAQRPPDQLRRSFAMAGTAVAALAVLALGLMRVFFPGQGLHPSAAIWVGLLLVVAGYPMVRAIIRPADATLRAAAWGGLLGAVLVDATMVAFTRHFLLSAPVAAIVLAALYARRVLEAPSPDAETPLADKPGSAEGLPAMAAEAELLPCDPEPDIADVANTIADVAITAIDPDPALDVFQAGPDRTPPA